MLRLKTGGRDEVAGLELSLRYVRRQLRPSLVSRTGSELYVEYVLVRLGDWVQKAARCLTYHAGSCTEVQMAL